MEDGQNRGIKWAIGIITAPRSQGYYLDQTLQSLSNAGWENPVIFAEPNSIIPESFNGEIVRRRKVYGDWTNWASGLYELFLSEPDSDYFFMLEDDALVSRCKGYLEYALPKLGEFGSCSLYTPSIYCEKNFLGFHNELRGMRTWSTVTVIMKHEMVLKFFADVDVQSHRTHDIFKVPRKYWGGHGGEGSYGKGYTSIIDTVGNTLKDAVIGKWAEKMGLPVYYHTPSLAEHIGFYSTLTNDDSSPENGRMSKDFVGIDFDSSIWIDKSVNMKKFVTIPL